MRNQQQCSLTSRTSLVGSHFCRLMGVAFGLLVAGSAAAVGLSVVPPFLLEGVAPNLVITIDDSTSMQQTDAPDLYPPSGYSACLASPDVNKLYFDPDKVYAPGMRADGSVMDQQLWPDATRYPYRGVTCGASGQIDLSLNYQRSSTDICGRALTPGGGSAYYYRYNGSASYSRPVAGASITQDVCDTDPQNAECETVDCAIAHPNPDDHTPDACFVRHDLANSPAAEQNNFANWYTYYRTRWLTTKTIISRVMQTLNPRVRLTYQGVGEPLGFKPSDAMFQSLVGRFDTFANNREDFFDWLLNLTIDDVTYVTASHIRAGEFVRQGVSLADSIVDHKKAKNDAEAGSLAPSADNSCGIKCRNNFHLLMTDGYWQDRWGPGEEEPCGFSGCTPVDLWPKTAVGTDTTGQWIGVNQDGSNHILPTPDSAMIAKTEYVDYGVTDYTATDPLVKVFADDNIGMLADVAFRYWVQDLVTSGEGLNQVPRLITEQSDDPALSNNLAVEFWNPNNDPATWQHLRLYTIGLGVTGDVLYDASVDPFGTGTYNSGADTIQEDGFPGSETAVNSIAAGTTWVANSIPKATKIDDLYHAAINARGRYFNASDPESLLSSFSAVLDTVSADAENENVSNTSAVMNTANLAADSKAYQVTLSVIDWSGDLRAFDVALGTEKSGDCKGKPRGQLCQAVDSPRWSASAQMPDWDHRVIITRANGAAAKFRNGTYDSLSDTQKRGLLGCNPAPTWTDPGCINPSSLAAGSAEVTAAKARIDYLRGDSSNEPDAAGSLDFRERGTGANRNIIGDILGSNAVVVGPPGRVFTDPDYMTTYRNAAPYKDRDTLIYVGANDGMLHAFDAGTGAERFAYVPEMVYPLLARLTDPLYNSGGAAKTAFVDGPLAAADAKIEVGSTGTVAWRTVLVGSLGLGGQGIYALDVSDPRVSNIDEANPTRLPLWEFDDSFANATGTLHGRDLGYSLSPPVIVRIDSDLSEESSDPTWVALISNGYNNTSTSDPGEVACSPAATPCVSTVSQTGNAVLYVLNLTGSDTARIYAVMDTGVGTSADPAGQANPNGLSAVTAVDTDGDLIADLAYAGDLFGNLWRFDLTAASLGSPVRLFTATDGSGANSSTAGVPQPITTKVLVHRHPTGIGSLILFGTGQYLSDDDKSDLQVQTFYAIWDSLTPSSVANFSPPTRDQLFEQSFQQEATVESVATNGGTSEIVSKGRSSTNWPIDWSVKKGWYIDLKLGNTVEGERVVVAPQLRGNRVVFVSMIPEDCCSSGGLSWVNALDASDGSRLPTTPFDYNGDGGFDNKDMLSVKDPQTNAPIDVVGSSIRVMSDGGSGIYSGPSTMGIGDGGLMSIVADSEGDLIQLRESSALDWRNWVEIHR